MKLTQLSPAALPGKRYTKISPGPHTGLFTALSAMTLPGMRHSFVAKDAATGKSPWYDEFGLRRHGRLDWQRIRDEDDDLFEMISMIVSSGILE